MTCRHEVSWTAVSAQTVDYQDSNEKLVTAHRHDVFDTKSALEALGVPHNNSMAACIVTEKALSFYNFSNMRGLALLSGLRKLHHHDEIFPEAKAHAPKDESKWQDMRCIKKCF
mmetsp:Transcript_334/g.971  ORF Transcript_334/g.971 Transcript_334/m.971 type:complete len:114 (+) Transcript_334:205-546(+)